MIMKIEKYKVSQELMNEIDEWRYKTDGLVVSADLRVGDVLPWSIHDWWIDGKEYDLEYNNRLIALIQYVNGEDVFEVEKPKKWVVRSTNSDDYSYIEIYTVGGVRLLEYRNNIAIGITTTSYDYIATKFNTKEEAEKWTNPLMEVVEVEDDC